MLQKQTVYPETFAVLERLNSLPVLADFALAGGTALALYYGHRISVDLDFFIDRPFDNEPIIIAIEQAFSQDKVDVINVSKNSITLIINDVKIDIIAHQYTQIEHTVIVENIRLYAIKDIIAMKLNALANRSSKKDFFDIYEALQHFSVAEILSFFKLKYRHHDTYYILRSLTYFDDADKNANPVMLNEHSWEDVKNGLQKYVEIHSEGTN